MKKKFEALKWLSKEQSKEIKTPLAQNGDQGNSHNDVEIVTRRIEEAGADITVGYAAWRDVGFALSDALGESGRSYYHRLSRMNPDYQAEETDKQYDRCLKAHGTGVTIKTFFQMAKDAGISVSTPSKTSNSSFPSHPRNEGNEVLEVSDGEQDTTLPTFSQNVRGSLPDLLEKVVAEADSDADGDILLLGSLAVISACLPNVMGIYNKRPVWSNLFLFVTARASSGKGRLALCRYLVEPIHDEMRQRNEAEMMDYKQRLQQYNCAKNKANLEKPEEPPLRMLFIPANSSATAVYQVLNDNEGQGIMFETEGDTLANTFSSDYGNYSDGFRKAFHHESISYVRRKDHEYVNLRRPRLSTLLTGTPKQVLSLITDAENGLFSRFIFYYMDTRLEWQDVFSEDPGGTLDEYFQSLGEAFKDYYTLLKGSGEIRFRMTDTQAAAFNGWFRKEQLDFVSKYGDEMVASVRRMGLITFRIAMILSALRLMEDIGHEPNLICSDTDFHTAMTIAGVLVEHTGRVFRELPKASACGGNQRTVQKQLFLDKLPSEFDRKTFIEVSAELGIPLSTAERTVKKWCNEGLVSRLEQGRYKKQ